jgi:hypothetical protein
MTRRSTANLHVTDFKQRTRIDPKYAAVSSSAEQKEHERNQTFNPHAAWKLQHALSTRIRPHSLIVIRARQHEALLSRNFRVPDRP